LIDQIREIADAGNIKTVQSFNIRSDLNESETYFQGSLGESVGGGRNNSGTEGPSGLLRAAIDHVLVPYAKAVATERYRLSPERFGERFGLTTEQVAYIKDALRPKSGLKRSTSKIITGEETLEVTESSKGTRSSRTNLDVMTAL
jgi:hypothetical protein